MRRIVRGLAAIVLAVMFSVVVGTFVPRPLFSASVDAKTGDEKRTRILVLSGPIHTDIALPLDAETLAVLPFLQESGVPIDHPNARWLIVGWGGRAFYLQTPTWSELKPLPVFKAFTVDQSVMHVDVAGAIDETQESVTGIDIDAADYSRLLSFVAGSFKTENGEVIPIADAGYGETDQFFEAHGWFNAMLGCNTWTAAALRQAGLRTGWWNPLPNLLSFSLNLFNEPQIVADR